MGKPFHKTRCDKNGAVYEWVSIGRYRRIEPPRNGVVVPILSTEIMLEVEDGLFTRTHHCVTEVPCPHCRAPVGKLCGYPGTPSSSTHYMRRDAAVDRRRRRPLPGSSP